MELFRAQELQNYFQSLKNNMESEISKISDSEIVSCDIQEWTEYLVNKYSLIPITLFETNIEQSLCETKVKKINPFRGCSYEPDYFEEDGVVISFKIPFDGNQELLEMQPSSFILSRFPVSGFINPNESECGSFCIELEFTKNELQEKGENMACFVQERFENAFKSYKSMVDNVNSDVDSYNNSLSITAKKFLNKQKDKAESFMAISNALQIPLKPSKNAPNTKPITLQRITKKNITKPNIKPVIQEPYISDEDYDNINNIILMCGTTMEKTARTYYVNNEEELRDHLLAALNTHYESATGETFRKIGKTDIHIEFENKAAFIGECKIWHGEKLFQDSIQQVINYSTWRDLKVSVIIFNKDNKSFPLILSKIKAWIENNAKTFMQPQTNRWECKYHRDDINEDIQLNILVFDLFVDKSQFKDIRY